MTNSTQRYWIFSHCVNSTPVSDRSTEYEWRAIERVKELRDRGQEDAFYTTELPEKFFS